MSVRFFSIPDTGIHDPQTHNVALVKPYTQFAVSLAQDGKILSQGSIADALVHDRALLARAALDNELLEMAKQPDAKESDASHVQTDTKAASSGKLVVEEEIDIGRVSSQSSMLRSRGLCHTDDCGSSSVPPRTGWRSSLAFFPCLYPGTLSLEFFFELSDMVSWTMGSAV